MSDKQSNASMDNNNQSSENTPQEGETQEETTAQTIPIEEASIPREPKSPDSAAQKTDADQARANWEKLLRVTADFENFKKRVTRERSESAKYSSTSLLLSLLPVLDNLESAVTAADQAKEASMKSLQQGVAMVSQQFKSALKENGLTEIEARGQAFDPNLHEAVSQLESSEVPEGQVLEQLRRGYMLHDRLLRPATVVVAKAPDNPSASKEESTPEHSGS
jgi:molecular chaperone GrpE